MRVGNNKNVNLPITGPTKPQYDETLNEKVKKKFFAQKELKYGSNILKAEDITEKLIFCLKSGDFLDSKQKKWNCQFEGEVQFNVQTENGFLSKTGKIVGKVQVENDEVTDVSDEISLSL